MELDFALGIACPVYNLNIAMVFYPHLPHYDVVDQAVRPFAVVKLLLSDITLTYPF